MGYKTVLVYVQNERDAGDSAELAVSLANRDAITHVIGLYVIPGVPVYPAMPAGAMSGILGNHREHHRTRAVKLQQVFEKTTAVDGVTAEWRIDESPTPSVAAQVIEHSRATDLIVLAQPEDHGVDSEGHDKVAQVLTGSGRPVLVVPRPRRFETVGECVLLAWNATKEAGRATFDALPLLASAKSVGVVTVNPIQNEDRDAFPAGAELAVSLARHGVKADVIADLAVGRSVGRELLACGADIGCDLIVMGGYGHSPFRETFLGGATRHVLEHMTVPVLMSH